MTSGFSAKRGSLRASATSMTSAPSMAWEQNERARGVSRTPESPTDVRNHWRCSSTRLTIAIGVPQTRAATRVSASIAALPGVSRSS